MKFCIEWTIFLHVSTQAKCERALGKIRHALGLPLDDVRMESYWKDDRLFKVLATTCIDASTATNAFYTIMKSVNGIARLWTVNGPTEGDLWEFSGTTALNSALFSEIESVSFNTVGNHEQAKDALAAHA